MIISLSQEVCQQIQEIDHLERLATNLSSLQITFDALVQLKEVVMQLKSLVLLHEGRLAEQTVQEIARDMERLALDVQASFEKLETQPHQEKSLKAIQGKAQNLIKTIRDHWKRYAEEYTRETQELLRLVSYLPEVEAQQATYQMLTARLQHYIDHIPRTPAQLAECDVCLQQLNQHLSNIQGLNREIKIFLEKVLKGQATLADLTEEVLQWCRQGEHSQVFVISFNRGK